MCTSILCFHFRNLIFLNVLIKVYVFSVAVNFFNILFEWFSGEVQVWDMGREDDTLIATSGMGSDSHREPVTKVK